MTATLNRRTTAAAQTTKRVGLVVRVSTDRQAMTDEGSLVTQLQRLRKHLEYKTAIGGDDWVEVAVYELKGISGKDSVRSPEFQALYADIRSGRVNVLAATALDRMTRSRTGLPDPLRVPPGARRPSSSPYGSSSTPPHRWAGSSP